MAYRITISSAYRLPTAKRLRLSVLRQSRAGANPSSPLFSMLNYRFCFFLFDFYFVILHFHFLIFDIVSGKAKNATSFSRPLALYAMSVWGMELAVRVELTTTRLQGGSSTVELRQLGSRSDLYLFGLSCASLSGFFPDGLSAHYPSGPCRRSFSKSDTLADAVDSGSRLGARPRAFRKGYKSTLASFSRPKGDISRRRLIIRGSTSMTRSTSFCVL